MAEITIHEADCVAWLRAYGGTLLDHLKTRKAKPILDGGLPLFGSGDA